jgi:hypothetical protein
MSIKAARGRLELAVPHRSWVERMHERVFAPTPKSPTIKSSPRFAVPRIPSPRRSSWICEPISEEPLSIDPEEQTPALQRHHRPRAPFARTNSAPQLISTTTTAPVYIKCVPPSRPSLSLTSAACQLLSCLAVTPTLLASAAPATSTSRPPPPVSRPRPCAMSSVH